MLLNIIRALFSVIIASFKKKLTTAFILACSLFILSNQTLQAAEAKANNKNMPVCAYIASYAPGYKWQDGIEQGIQESLAQRCEIKTFFMNSKKVSTEASLQQIGLQAVDFIKRINPEIVIVSDDHAVKYVLMDHYKNSPLPFVYCGVNNTGLIYGLPYRNTTGMVEKNPTEKLLRLLFNLNPSKTHVAFLTTTGTSADIDVSAFHKLVIKLKIKSSTYQIQNEQDWRSIYKNIQEDPNVDIIFFSNNATFPSWNHKKNMAWVLKYNNKLSVTTKDSMLPYVALGMNKSAKEHGSWAGNAAIEILNGIAPNKLAVVPNQKFQLWVNPRVIKPFRTPQIDEIISQSLVYNSVVSE